MSVTAAPSAKPIDELAMLAAAGDGSARARLVEEMLPLLRRWSRRYAGRGMELDDLVQDAVVGLLRALSRYDPQRGVPFAAFARIWVRQALQQSVAEHSRPVRLPTHVLWDMHELKEARERLARELRREPRLAELADALGWSPQRIGDVLLVEHPPVSLHERRPGREVPVADLLEDSLAGDAYEEVVSRLAHDQLRPLLMRLTAREREVLARRADGESLRSIGRRLGVSGERVRAIEGRALAKIRAGASAGVDSDGRALTSPGDTPDHHLEVSTREPHDEPQGSAAR